MRQATREAVSAYLLLAPAFLGFIVFGLIPILSSFALGFTQWDLLSPPKLAGLYNFRHMIKDSLVLVSFRNTLIFVLLNVPFGTLIFPLSLAMLLNHGKAGVKLLRAAYFIPVMTLSVSAGFVWRLMLNPDFGIVNYILSIFGIPPVKWLINPRISLLSLVLVNLWKWVGYNMVIFLAALKGIPRMYYEAVRIDGANKMQSFLRITLPMLLPSIIFVVIVGLIGSFQFFDFSYIMTQGGPGNSTLVYNLYVYKNAFQFSKMGYASSLAWILFIIIFLLTIVQLKVMQRGTSYE